MCSYTCMRNEERRREHEARMRQEQLEAAREQRKLTREKGKGGRPATRSAEEAKYYTDHAEEKRAKQLAYYYAHRQHILERKRARRAEKTQAMA